ncbi:MAG: HAD family hydrolase [Firmicutes bacterium]|nr:HAD family hydrolase [Bacillota bacterium]
MGSPRDLDGFIFDLDGCIWTGEDLVPGAREVIDRLRDLGKRVGFLTNNSTQSARKVATRLRRMGIPAAAGMVVVSADLAGPYLASRHGHGKVLVIGSPALRRSILRAGHTLVSWREVLEEGRIPDMVTAGMDVGFHYRKLTAAAVAVARGAFFYACNVDPRLPLEGGRFLPGTGSIARAIAVAAGADPAIIGKPEPPCFLEALRRLGTPPARTAMVGDSPRSDIAGGRRAGLFTILLDAGGAGMGPGSGSSGPGSGTGTGQAEGEVIPHLRVQGMDELLAWISVPAHPRI